MAETEKESVGTSHSDADTGTSVKSEAKVTGELKVKKVSKPAAKAVTVVFKQNRKFDLHVGRELMVFEGREAKQIPVEWLQHPDFRQVSKYFIVKGV